jgi:hypothetical protein
MHYPLSGIRRDSESLDDSVETICETPVALRAAAAICIGVTGLSSHLNEAQTARAEAAETPVAMPSGSATAGSATRFN